MHKNRHTTAPIYSVSERCARSQEDCRNGCRVHVAHRVRFRWKGSIRQDAARKASRRQTENAVADTTGTTTDGTANTTYHSREVRTRHAGISGIHVQHVEHVTEVQANGADGDVEASFEAIYRHFVFRRSSQAEIRKRAPRLWDNTESRRNSHLRARAESRLHRYTMSIARAVRNVPLCFRRLRPFTTAAFPSRCIHVEVHRIDVDIWKL